MADREKNGSDDAATKKTSCLTLFPEVPADHKHCLALNCLSFTMGMLLPTRHILFKQNKQELLEKCRAQFAKLPVDTSGFDVLFYGLNFEDLSYPTLLPKPDPAEQLAIMPPGKGYESIWLNDGFSLIWPKEWEVVLEEDDVCNVKLQLVVDHNGLREHGSFKLRLAGTNDFLSDHLHKSCLKLMRSKIRESSHENDTSGPNLPDAERTTFGYKCVTWPIKFTATWLQKATLHGWPDQEIIGRIVSAGCHVIPCSDKPESCKWKFSFAEAEQILTSILTVWQRQCFMFIEILIDRCFRSRDVLTPVHLKHIFFHLCEKIDPDKWGQEDGLAFACLTLINDINYALDHENIPNYFIPELNMLQNVEQDSIKSLKENIKSFREAPLVNLFNLFERYRFEFAPLQMPIGKVLEDISDLIENCEKDPTAVRSAFLETASAFSTVDFLEDRIEEGIANLTYASDLLGTYFGLRMSLVNEIFKKTTHLSPDVSANIFETYMKVISDDDEAYSATENLACVYHACIHEQQEATPQYQYYKQKTEETFQKCFSMPQSSSATKCDYVLFLIKFNKIDEAIDMLQDVIKTETNSPEKLSSNSYGKSEIKNVDENLAKEINANTEISMLSILLTFYLYINLESQKSDEQSTKSSVMLSEYERICWAIDEAKSETDDKDPIMFSMLGYSFIASKNYEKAKECFSKALEIKPDYALAKENRDFCEGMCRSMQCETQ